MISTNFLNILFQYDQFFRFIYETGFVWIRTYSLNRMSITIKKIAKDLKLAVSTVSKALSDSYEISDDTKLRVLEYARKMSYVPNAYAGSLKNRKTRNIAVVLPEVADTFFSNAINGIESVAQGKGYHVMVYLTHESQERELSILQDLRGGRVDGILISVSRGVESDSAIHEQLAREMPLIFFDRVCEGVQTAKVLTDDFESSFKATCHLLEKGCKQIVFLSTDEKLSIIDQRKNGFIKALQQNNFEVTDDHVVMCSEDEEESLSTIRKVLSGRPRVDGIVGSVEKLALQAYSVCNEKNLIIPKDVKVLAFSNIQIANLLSPSLTTIVQPAFDMGREAAALLFKALAKKVDLKKETIILPSNLIERKSTS